MCAHPQRKELQHRCSRVCCVTSLCGSAPGGRRPQRGQLGSPPAVDHTALLASGRVAPPLLTRHGPRATRNLPCCCRGRHHRGCRAAAHAAQICADDRRTTHHDGTGSGARPRLLALIRTSGLALLVVDHQSGWPGRAPHRPPIRFVPRCIALTHELVPLAFVFLGSDACVVQLYF